MSAAGPSEGANCLPPGGGDPESAASLGGATSNVTDSHVAIARIAEIFNTMTVDDVPRMGEFYTDDASFRDPFNDVRGLPQIKRIFAGMYDHLIEPRFRVLETVADERGAFLVWDMTFRIRRYQPDVPWTIHGTTHMRLAPDGRIAYHRDYWDTGEELYAKLPLIGVAVRFLRRKLA